MPVHGPPIAVAHVVKERLDALIDRARADSTVTQRVLETLPALLAARRPTAAEAARRLGLGRRTLERRLDDEGTSFRDLLAGTRQQLARLWLPDLPIAEVADRLAYGDVRAFDRAFRRWTGTTPSAWRARPRPRSARTANPTHQRR
jgi:AraC-like DNA-binding protein